MFCSCGPQSKESYLKKYDSFIGEVGKNCAQYTEKDWEIKDREFKQLSDEWYNKFKDDFTLQDEVKLAANRVKYKYYLVSKKSSAFFKQLFDNPEINEIKSQIKFYVDNQMKEDIGILLKEAKKAGREAETIVTQILNDFKITLEEDD
jgi:hypothetical protein